FPGNARGREVQFTGKIRETGIVNHTLEERLVLPAFGMLEIEEIVLSNGGCGEGIRLHDIRSSLEVFAVDFLDDLRLGQEQNFVITLEILARPVGESFSSELGLGELVTLNDCPHGAIDDDDALGKQLFERGGRIWIESIHSVR